MNWVDVPTDAQSVFRKNCRSYMQTASALQQAQKYSKESDDTNTAPEIQHVPIAASSSTLPRTRQHSDPLQCKNLCIWCMDPEDKNENSLRCSQQLNSWNIFRFSTAYLENEEMREYLHLLTLQLIHLPQKHIIIQNVERSI